MIDVMIMIPFILFVLCGVNSIHYLCLCSKTRSKSLIKVRLYNLTCLYNSIVLLNNFYITVENINRQRSLVLNAGVHVAVVFCRNANENCMTRLIIKRSHSENNK